jgi:hypothetical protein
MALFRLFRKKKAPRTLCAPASAASNIAQPEDHDDLLLLAQAARHLEIMRDSANLIQTTVSPGTFFGRYRTLVHEAQIVLHLCGNHEITVATKNLLHLFEKNRTLFIRAFLDRCYENKKLHFVKDEIMQYRGEMPQKCYAYFLSLLHRHEFETDMKKYIFCSVAFHEGGKTYYYLSDDKNLRIGDFVIVPVGKYNEEKTGRITEIKVYQGSHAPVPADHLKHIIGLA